MLCYVHHPKLLVFLHWLNLATVYIHSNGTGSHVMIYYYMQQYSVGLNEVDCTIDLGLELLIN